jgi:predicted PurR-regulated permease PerM
MAADFRPDSTSSSPGLSGGSISERQPDHPNKSGDDVKVGSTARWKRRALITWTVIGAALIVLACLYGIGLVWTTASVILFSAFLVFILRVPVAWLQSHHVPRALGAAVCYIVALALIALILLVFVPAIVEQVVGFVSLIPGYAARVQDLYNTVVAGTQSLMADSTIKQLITTATSSLTAWASSLVAGSAGFLASFASGIANGVFVLGVSVIVGFWILKDLPTIQREIHALFPPRLQADSSYIAAVCSKCLGGYVLSMVVSCLFEGVTTGICYFLIGQPYPLVFAMFTGLMVFIPFIGPIIAWLTAGVFALFVSPLTAILAVVLTIVCQMLNDYVLNPQVVKHNIALHPALSLVAITCGAALGGIFGMLCAVPLTAAVKTIFVHYFEQRTGRPLSGPHGAFFKQADDSVNNRTVAMRTVLFRRKRSPQGSAPADSQDS